MHTQTAASSSRTGKRKHVKTDATSIVKRRRPVSFRGVGNRIMPEASNSSKSILYSILMCENAEILDRFLEFIMVVAPSSCRIRDPALVEDMNRSLRKVAESNQKALKQLTILTHLNKTKALKDYCCDPVGFVGSGFVEETTETVNFFFMALQSVMDDDVIKPSATPESTIRRIVARYLCP